METIRTSKHIQTANYEANVERHGLDSNTCDCCGRPTAAKLFIHYTTYGEVINTRRDDFENFEGIKGESQGGFHIGPECAKKYPAGFVFTSEPEEAEAYQKPTPTKEEVFYKGTTKREMLLIIEQYARLIHEEEGDWVDHATEERETIKANGIF